MSRSSSPHSGATPPPSVRGLNPPIVTFVGRLDASQKGFDVFLDAIELAEHSICGSFSAWLVGGAYEEVELVLADISKRRALAAMHSAGRLTLWGRVDIDSLPELYSRSTLVAVPSRREAFGLVAVQAMLCGAPVAASYVGGLKHTILHRLTGAHFQPGNTVALAFIIVGLTNNRPLAEWLGASAAKWSLAAFGDDSPNSGLGRILRAQNGAAAEPHLIENSSKFFVERDEIDACDWVRDATLDAISTNNNTTFKATHSSGEISFVKVFTERPDFDQSVYRLSPELEPSGWRSRVDTSLVASASPHTIPLLDTSGRMMRFAWSTATVETAAVILALARGFGLSLERASAPAIEACRHAYDRLCRKNNWRALYEFDLAAAKLNAPLTGSNRIFVRCDPRVELIRIRLHLTTKAWPLSAEMHQAMAAVVALSETFCTDEDEVAMLSHGDLNLHHIREISGRALLCDLEDVRYSFGDLDAGSLALSILRSSHGNEQSFGCVAEILGNGMGPQGSCGATLWLVVQALHKALGAATWGQPEKLIEASEMCGNLLEMMAHLIKR